MSTELDDNKLLGMLKSYDTELVVLAVRILIGQGLERLVNFVDHYGKEREPPKGSTMDTLFLLTEKVIPTPLHTSKKYIKFVPEGKEEAHYVFYGEWISVFTNYHTMAIGNVIDLQDEVLINHNKT